jgi:FixJ family two-component response regulator
MQDETPVKALVSVVDDDESVRESLPDLLREFGFFASAYASGKEFLNSDCPGKAACLVLDIAMPEMSGPELRRELEHRGYNIPTIFITAHPEAAARPEIKGAAACLIKPFSAGALQDALKKALRQKKSRIVLVGELTMSMTASPGASSEPPAAPQPTPVVFVVDDDISVRESLELMIRHQGWKPELFESAQAFLHRSPVSVPSCLVLDVDLPDLSGLDLQERLENRAVTPIIFLTGHGDIPMTVRAMKAGAVEFLTKPFEDEVLLVAIHGAIERSRAALEKQAGREILRERFASLSQRERDVMQAVVRGLLNKQVGGKLGISEITVKAHRGKVMRKMKASSFAELVNMAAELGISSPNL